MGKSMTDNALSLAKAEPLTTDEIAIIARFSRSLRDVGVQAVLMSTYVQGCSERNPEFYADVARTFLLDISRTEPEAMHEAAVSLAVLVDVAKECGDLFPEEVLPTDETVDKCLAAFWAQESSS